MGTSVGNQGTSARLLGGQQEGSAGHLGAAWLAGASGDARPARVKTSHGTGTHVASRRHMRWTCAQSTHVTSEGPRRLGEGCVQERVQGRELIRPPPFLSPLPAPPQPPPQEGAHQATTPEAGQPARTRRLPVQRPPRWALSWNTNPPAHADGSNTPRRGGTAESH